MRLNVEHWIARYAKFAIKITLQFKIKRKEL